VVLLTEFVPPFFSSHRGDPVEDLGDECRQQGVLNIITKKRKDNHGATVNVRYGGQWDRVPAPSAPGSNGARESPPVFRMGLTAAVRRFMGP